MTAVGAIFLAAVILIPLAVRLVVGVENRISSRRAIAGSTSKTGLKAS